MTDQDRPLTELAKTAMESLSALRSEIALQLHLAGMDARKAWAEVGPEAEALERRLAELVKEASTGQAQLELHLALMEARDRWRKIEPRIEGEAKAGLQRAFEQITTAIERLRKDKPS
jgi:hypothetical protein